MFDLQIVKFSSNGTADTRHFIVLCFKRFILRITDKSTGVTGIRIEAYRIAAYTFCR